MDYAKYIGLGIAISGFAAGFVAACFRLLSLAGKLGASAQRIETAQAEFASKIGALDEIPKLLVRVGVIENYVARNTSDIKDLIGKTAEHRGRLESLHDHDHD